MVSIRKITFLNNYYYHIFNRGIDKRNIFNSRYDYIRALDLLYYYQFTTIPVRFSHFDRLPKDKQSDIREVMIKSGGIAEILSYCLMPNHFHLLIKQIKEDGITKYLSNFTNGYTRFFNLKYGRDGSLFQGVFKAVFVESDEQLLHLTRYIHLNPCMASIVEEEKLSEYKWSSYPGYLNGTGDMLITKNSLSTVTSQINNYEKFVCEQIPYARILDKIKHEILD